jgi:hypothetical protein
MDSDATVLFAPWFIDNTCLRLLDGMQSSPGVLAVEFTPETLRRGIVEIAGQFVFDSATLELRELRFHWIGLPGWVPLKGPGGEVTFRRHESGAWLPMSWTMRAPRPEVGSSGTRLLDYAERGGRVVRIGR